MVDALGFLSTKIVGLMSGLDSGPWARRCETDRGGYSSHWTVIEGPIHFQVSQGEASAPEFSGLPSRIGSAMGAYNWLSPIPYLSRLRKNMRAPDRNRDDIAAPKLRWASASPTSQPTP